MSSYAVFAGVTARRGYRGTIAKCRLIIEPPDRVVVRSEKYSGKAAQTAALTGQTAGPVGVLVGAVIGSAIERVVAGPGTVVLEPLKASGSYSERRCELSLEVPDGRWLDVRFMFGQKTEFPDALAELQAIYGERLSPGPVGKLSLTRLLIVISILALLLSFLAAVIAFVVHGLVAD